MQNVVVVSQTVCTHVAGTTKSMKIALRETQTQRDKHFRPTADPFVGRRTAKI